MNKLSGTRALKNAKHIRAVAPQVFPAAEPPDGFASVVPFDVLNRFHRMSEDELRTFPGLVEAQRELRKRKPASPRVMPLGIIFADSPFQGTLHFAKLTFRVGAKTFSVSDADMATIQRYATLAVPAVAKYAAQYGENRLTVASKILTMTVDVPSGKYNDDTLQGWVRTLMGQAGTAPVNTCIIVCNPPGVVNTDGDRSKGILGYHDNVVTARPSPAGGVITTPSPYCFVNVEGSGLTVDDRADQYALALTHEIAEMTVDPYVSWTNPEVCDGCAGNCNNEWRSFFAGTTPGAYDYLRSFKGFPPPPFRFDFYTAAVAQPSRSDDCPAPEAACAYAPSAKAGVGELLFYERPDGYAELYSVDANANIALQTTHPDWRSSWSLIVPGKYSPKPAGSRRDLLFYDRGAGWGEFYQTGSVGDMHQFSIHNNWRTTWSIIVPGSFAAPGSMDVLFYEPSDGYGEFYRTDGRGNISLIASHANWRTTWSIILAGKFSNSQLSDLLFYDPVAGVGEFYSTDGRGNIKLIANHSNWRKTWSIILTGKFSDSGYDDLLFYDPTAGVGEFYRTDGRGNITLIANHSNWRTTWSAIVAGKFSNSAFTDLLFYDPTAGVGEFYRTDGRGNISSIQNHTNWRKTWSIIGSL
jgi:hypothetical protein